MKCSNNVRIKANHLLRVILLLSVSGLVTNAGEATLYTGAARNLTVLAFEDHKFHENLKPHEDIQNGLLKLNISWLPPEAGKVPVSYSVVVTTIRKESISDAIDCPEETAYYTTTNATQLQIELPEDPVIDGVPEMTIIPGCTYSVQVYANPRRNPTVQHPIVEYTVPECVGLKCSCSNVEKVLPRPDVAVEKLYDDKILIKWKFTKNYDNVKSYSLSIGVPILVSRGGLPVYNTTSIARLSAENQSFIWSDRRTNHDGIVYVTAEDIKGCSGPRGSYLLSSIKRNNYHAETMVIFIGSVVISILIFVTGSILWSNGRRTYSILLSNANNKAQRSSERFVQHQSFTGRLVLSKRNDLYIEQEIEEAIQNGEADGLEVSYSRINFKDELGNGQFGKVYLASIEGFKVPLVAVKVNHSTFPHNETSSRAQLIEEINIMKTVGPHPHLVELIGCCTLPAHPVCAILEYLEGGDLLGYLHNLRKQQCGSLTSIATDPTSACSARPSVTETLYTTLGSEPPTTPTFETFASKDEEIALQNSHIYENIQDSSFSQLLTNQEQARRKRDSIGLENDEFLKFAVDIAKGMQHLETKGITHRDLATRNILIDANGTLKVSDFGLSKNGVYVIAGSSTGRRLPIRWMSPEAMRDRQFSSKSDVWSYAVVLWEIGTLGAFPYPNVRDDQLLRHIVIENKRLTKPEAVSVELYAIMKGCFDADPSKRPNFSQLLFSLLGLSGSPYFLSGKSNPCYASLPPTEDELQDSPPTSPNVFHL